MQQRPLSLSLLTLAITAASLSAQAETYQIDDGPKTWENIIITDGLNISGALTTAADALTLKPGTQVLGDLIVDATIKTTGAENAQGRYARPLTLGSLNTYLNDRVRIDGDLINKGRLSTGGSDAIGIRVYNTNISGTLQNEGTISVEDSTFEGVNGNGAGNAMPMGLNLNNANLGGLSNSGRIALTSSDIARGIMMGYSQVTGVLENTSSGVIEVTGDEIRAISVSFLNDVGELINAGTLRATGITAPGDASNLSEANGISVGDSLVRGRLLNSGNITVSGYEATGIELITYGSNGDLARVNGDLVNSGSIDVSAVAEPGATARAIEISNATVGGALNNSGTIIARGTDSAAIHVDGGHIAGDIFNSGTIQGGRYGIYLKNLQPSENLPAHVPFSLIHQNAGTIEGGEYALYADPASTEARLIWAGGTLKGNIHGSTYIDVIGDAVFDGTHISGFGYGNSGGGGIDLFNAEDSPLGRAASLTLTQPHVTIDGHLEMNRGTVLQLNLSQATDPQTAIVKVRTDAYFSPSSSIALRPTSEDFRATGREYKVIEAGSVEYEGTDKLVVSSSALLNIDSIAITDTEVRATVTTKSDEQAGAVVGTAGASANARAAFAPFYSSALGQLDNDDPVFQAFANADEAQLAALSEQLAPHVDGAVRAAANSVQRMVSGAVGSRTSSLRGASSGSAFSEAGFWVQGHDSDLRQGRRSGIAGYDADSRGLSLGLDGKLNEQWTLGVAYSNLDTKVSGRTGNKSEIDSQVLTLYSGFEQGPIFVDTSLSYGFNDNTSKRDIAGTRAKGEFDSRSLALNLEAGYGLHAGGVTLEPRVATRYSRLDIDSYREKGSSAALAVSSQRYEAIELGAGARLASAIALGQGALEPELKLMAYHDFAADQSSSTSSFVLGGSSFVTHGAKPARDSYEASLGVNYRIGALSLGAGYEHVGRSGFDADTLRAKVRYDF